MNESSVSGIEAEANISVKPVIVLLVIMAVVLVPVSDSLPASPQATRLVAFALLFYPISLTAWLLENWRPWLGRWFTVLALIAIILLAAFWLDVSELVTLLSIPTALAAAVIALPAGIASAIGGSVLLILLPKYVATGVDVADVYVGLAAIWAMLGVMALVCRSNNTVGRRSWEYYRRAQRLVEEGRDRQVELRQALEDLADANLQLRRLHSLAQGLRQAAEDARGAKERFVANVSHELRTPLNMILGFSEMILQVPETYSRRIPTTLLADLAVIRRNAEHLSSLVDDVLDLSQIEAGRMALTKDVVSMHEIIEDAATVVRPLFVSKGLYLETEVPRNLPAVFCDPTRIREVVLNLLSNAGRFTERGGVHVRAWQEGSDVVVSISDTGPSISAEDGARIFRPFEQLASSIRRRYAGSGLGLAISKHFVELHEGKIWFESRPGSGTTFFFRLSIEPPPPTDDGALRWFNPYWHYQERTRRSTAPTAQLRPRLVVLEAGGSLQRLLTRYVDGVDVVPVTGPEEALEELSRTPAQALLINAGSVAKALEDLNSSTLLSNGTPAIICSVPGMPEARAAVGVSDYLVKPVARDELLGALDQLELRGKTVLIVDDEPDALQLFRRMLASSGRGYQVLLARDGREAVDALSECRPDVILLDLIMPDLDGFQLLEMKARDPALRDIPVVVVSARDPAGQPIASSALGVTQRGGLSVHQLLTCIEAVSTILSTTGQTGGPMPTESVPD